MPMTNAELADAINQAWQLRYKSTPDSDLYKLASKQYERLMDLQYERAKVQPCTQ